MLIRDLMTKSVVTVGLDTPLHMVARALEEQHVRSLPVVDDHGRIVGMVSETDVVRDAVPSDPWSTRLQPHRIHGYPTRAADVMTFAPVVVPPDLDVPVAAELLSSPSMTSLPVVEDGVVIGILSRSDIVGLLASEPDGSAP